MKSSGVLTFLLLVAVAKSSLASKPRIFRYRDDYGNIRMGVLRTKENSKLSIVPISSSIESSQESDSNSEYLSDDMSAYLHEYSRRSGPHKNADSVQEMYNISEEKLIDPKEKFAGVDDNSPEAHRNHHTYAKPEDCSSKHQVYKYPQSPHIVRPEGGHAVVSVGKRIYVNPPPLVVHQEAPKTCHPIINYKPPGIKIKPVIVDSKSCRKATKTDAINYKIYYDEHKRPHKNHHYVHSKESHSDSASDEKRPKIVSGSASFEKHPKSASDEKPSKPMWTYGKNDLYGPHNWGKVAAACDGKRQSPIALSTHNANHDHHAKPLRITGLDWKPSSLFYNNDGKKLNLKFNYPKGKKVRISGGPLKVPYILEGVHWHWGKRDEAGSEHTLDNKRYSAELHMVFYNSNYNSIAEAIKDPKGLAVLGVFYELDDDSNNFWSAYTKKITKANSSFTERKNLYSIRDLLQDDDLNILSYKGSLTNPDCNENVTWMVSTKPLSITSSELNQLRGLKNSSGKPILKNYRPLQSRNGRVITKYN